MSHAKRISARDSAPQLNVVFGSGGSRAILSGAGAIMSFELAGLKNWNSIGGVSGGSIPAIMLANGVSAGQLVRLAIDTEFSSMLERRVSYLRVLLAMLFKFHYEVTLPEKGVFGYGPLERFINSNVEKWPDKFWTMAIRDDAKIVFDAEGAWEFSDDGSLRKLDDERLSTGLAVSATCAVPGVIDAVRFGGGLLFDGGIGTHGRCPAEVAVHRYGINPSDVIACDVGEDTIKNSWVMRTVWHILCSIRSCGQIDGIAPDRSGGLIVIEPEPAEFHSLNFTPTLDQKWKALLAGFSGAVEVLESEDLLTGPALEEAHQILSEANASLKRGTKAGAYAERAASVLCEHGLCE